MKLAQMFRADLNSTGQLAVFFLAAAVTAVLLTVWSAITRATHTIANLARRPR